jgi:hypothetical protein
VLDAHALDIQLAAELDHKALQRQQCNNDVTTVTVAAAMPIESDPGACVAQVLEQSYIMKLSLYLIKFHIREIVTQYLAAAAAAVQQSDHDQSHSESDTCTDSKLCTVNSWSRYDHGTATVSDSEYTVAPAVTVSQSEQAASDSDSHFPEHFIVKLDVSQLLEYSTELGNSLVSYCSNYSYVDNTMMSQ